MKGQVTTNVSETISLDSCIQKTNTECTSLLNASEHDINLTEIHSVISKKA